MIKITVGAQMKLCDEEMFDFLHQLLECEATSNGVKATAVYLINCLVHNNGVSVFTVCVCVPVCGACYVSVFIIFLSIQVKILHVDCFFIHTICVETVYPAVTQIPVIWFAKMPN